MSTENPDYLKDIAAKKEEEANRRWPLPDIVSKYRSVLELHESCRHEDAIDLMRRLPSEPLRLAPDDAVTTNIKTFFIYQSGRQYPVTILLYRLSKENNSYADELKNTGDIKGTIKIFAVNLALARSLARLEPNIITTFSMANTMWQGAWKQIGEALKTLGDEVGFESAEQFRFISAEFSKQRIKPCSEQEIKEFKEMATWLSILFPSRRRKFLNNSLSRIQSLAVSWTQEVDTQSARDFINSIS